MRVSQSRWSLLVVAVCCLSLTSSTGCKSGLSMPGADWLSWAKRPAPPNFATNTYPPKPSASGLPNPTATTGTQTPPTYPGFGGQNYAANQTTGTNGYFTGPYNTGANPRSRGTTGYANGAAATPKTNYASAPYQSPYPSQTAGATSTGHSHYSTADARNGYSNAASNAATGSRSYSGAPANTGSRYGSQYGTAGSDPYNSGQTGSTAYPSTSTTPSYPQAAGYSAPSTSGYQAPAPTPSSMTTGTPGYGATPTGSTGLSSGAGAFRPGSTGRNAGQLPQSTGSTTRNAQYPSTGSAYPSTTR